MKKKILFIAIILGIIASWIVFANKFERIVTEEFLPLLNEQKEKNLIHFDSANIRVEKYKFKIVISDFSYTFSGKDQVKIDEISICYNPITDNVVFYTSGKKMSTGLGELETYVNNPRQSIKLNKPVLTGDLDKINFVLISKKHEILSALDNSILLSSGEAKIYFTAKLHPSTNQYFVNIEAERSDVSMYEGFPGYFRKMLENQYTNKSYDNKNKLTDLMSSLVDYGYNFSKITGPMNDEAHISMNFDKIYLDNFVKLVKSEINFAEFSSVRAVDKPISLVVDAKYKNKLGGGVLVAELSSDAKIFKGKFDVSSNANYSPEQESEVVKFTSELAANVFNELKTSIQSNLTPEDFNTLFSHLFAVKNSNFSINMDHELDSRNFNAGLNIGINNYKIVLNGSGKDDKYNGILKISDPAKLIKAKTILVDEALPLIQKIDPDQVLFFSKINSNIRVNGFEALKALNNKPDLKEGDNFEVYFNFEPEHFEFKINDKPMLNIITDDRIVKFLKGMEESLETK